jgi:2-methylfumaryl-CoA isomerase
MTRLIGNFDGSPAVDYTVNCASGFPLATGPDEHPINHVLPAWDVAAGLYLALGIVTAERTRRLTGQGQETVLSLSDVMLATVANLGYVADVQVNHEVRQPIGNQLYGAYGRNFITSDRRDVMVVAISNRQWRAIGKATGLADKLAMIGPLLDLDISTEGGRYKAGPAISAVLEPWFAARTLAEVRKAFEGSGVLWGPYQDFRQLVEEDVRCSARNPMFAEIDQVDVGRVLAPRIPLTFTETPAPPAVPAPRLGQDTDLVLADVLGLSSREIASLRQSGILATA